MQPRLELVLLFMLFVNWRHDERWLSCGLDSCDATKCRVQIFVLLSLLPHFYQEAVILSLVELVFVCPTVKSLCRLSEQRYQVYFLLQYLAGWGRLNTHTYSLIPARVFLRLLLELVLLAPKVPPPSAAASASGITPKHQAWGLGSLPPRPPLRVLHPRSLMNHSGVDRVEPGGSGFFSCFLGQRHQHT